jgi:hypothetical protein
MPYRIQLRRGTASEWTAANPVLAEGEVGFESDTKKVKIGDGTTAWSSLSYGVVGEVADGSVTAQKLATGAVTETKIGNAAVSGAKLANLTTSTKTSSYVLVAADRNTRVIMNSASSTTITVNTGLFSAGDVVWVHNIGSGTCTVTAGTATVTTSGSLALAQWGGGSLYFTSASAAIFFPAGGGVSSLETAVNFTSTTSWTVPTGVTYVVAYIGGGGGSVSTSGAGSAGSASSVAFSGGTKSANGGNGDSDGQSLGDQTYARSYSGVANTCHGALITSNVSSGAARAADGAELVFGGAVTPGQSITITVGAGASGTYNGGSGYVRLEYNAQSKRRVDSFTSTGTWTVPSGVTLAKAYIRGGGGGATNSNDGFSVDGNPSSVAFASGTVTAAGGKQAASYRAGFSGYAGAAGAANSGKGGRGHSRDVGNGGRSYITGSDGQFVVATAAVTPGASISVTVGATASSGIDLPGGSGFVYIEYLAS